MGPRALTAAALPALLLAALSGCRSGPEPLYAWGSYEADLYDAWRTPGDTLDAERIRTLEDEVAEMRLEGRTPGPGIQAHIGWLRLRSGDAAGAGAWFELEKRDFPESATYLDGLLAGKPR